MSCKCLSVNGLEVARWIQRSGPEEHHRPESYLCLEKLHIQILLKLAEGSSDIGLGHAEGCCCLVQCLRHCQRSQHNELLQREGKGEVCCSSVTTKCSGTLYRVRSCYLFDAVTLCR